MEIADYRQAEAFLNSFINYEKLLGEIVAYDTKTFDLENFRKLLAGLGDPQRRYSVIHVAGTKGKGSTCAFLASILRASGFRVGLYTSPHITTYRERIAVDGQPIPEQRFCEILASLASQTAFACPAGHSPDFRTVFELLTASAFVHFAEQGVEVAVIETGLGGRLDSTNVFDLPPESAGAVLVDVIAAIGLDHTAILGDTVDKIAAEKAGILRPHAAAAVLAPQRPAWSDEVARVVRAHAEQKGCPLVEAGALVGCSPLHEDADAHPGAAYGEIVGRFFLAGGGGGDDEGGHEAACGPLRQALAGGLELTSHLLGLHQLDNLRATLAVLLCLERRGWRFDPAAVARGVKDTRWPGRFEIVSKDPLAIVDGAHCVLSAAALGRTFEELFGRREVLAVAGFMRDKAAEGMFRTIAETMNVRGVIACSPPSPRGLEAHATAALAREVFEEAEIETLADPTQAVRRAMERRAPGQAIVAFGSMFLIAPAKQALSQARNGLWD